MSLFAAVAKDGVRMFIRNDCMTSAAAISFYAFFSLIPLMFIMTAGVGFLIGTRPGLLERIIVMVMEVVPYLSPRIIADLKALSENWKTYGWLGVISLLYVAEFVMGATSEALTRIFETGHKFSFFRLKVVNLFGILLAILAALASIALTGLSYYIEATSVNVPGVASVYPSLVIILTRFAAPFLMLAGIVAAVFRFLAGPNLNTQCALFGSVLFALLWEAAKQLFAVYVANFGSYNKFYGSIGALMVLLVWIFYSANIFLFSASMARAAYLNGGYHLPQVRRRR